LVCRQAVGPHGETVRGWRLVQGEGLAGWVVSTDQSLIVADTWSEARHFKGVDESTGLALRSILSVPLQVKEKVIGVLQVADTETDRFNSSDLALVKPLATSAAIAIHNARLVEMLQQRTAELIERNEELDAFAHTVAHDLKSPLGIVVGFAQVLEETTSTGKAVPNNELVDYLQTIVRYGHKMSSIIDELLLLAIIRKADADMKVLDLESTVTEAKQRLSHMIKEHQAEILLADTWPTAMGYAPWVEEVWVNYISNAIKYGGQPPHIELGAMEQPDGYVRLWVKDNGPGIPLEHQGRLFTPLTRLDQTRANGHGLGLSIVRRIVEKLNGQVGVESEVGQGSVFSFTLPSSNGYEGV
jgi:signal transduction histidine kinase